MFIAEQCKHSPNDKISPEFAGAMVDSVLDDYGLAHLNTVGELKDAMRAYMAL